MGPSLALGEAAGVAAALAVRGAPDGAADVDREELRSVLRAGGAVI
jgi:hypothetical protein